MKKLILLSSTLLAACSSAPRDDLDLKSAIQPVNIIEAEFQENHYRTWGATILKEGDDYYMVYSRWKKRGGDWMTTSEIAIAKSHNGKIDGKYSYVKTLLTGRGKGHWDELMAHNPKLKKFGDKYYLYYISSKSAAKRIYTRDSQRIGVAVSDSLLGTYKHGDKPLLEPATPVYNITVNPDVVQRPDGKFIMIFKGDVRQKTPDEPMPKRVQGIAISNSPTEGFVIQPMRAIADIDTEDSSIWYDKDRKMFYAIFHAHAYIGLISSTDGINWKRATHYKICTKEFLTTDGTIERMAGVERPFVFIEDGKAKMLCISTHATKFYKGGLIYIKGQNVPQGFM